MAHTHEGGVRHDHEGGELTHSHDEEAATRRDAYPPPEERTAVRERDYPPDRAAYGARGGVSLGSIITGVAVAIGALVLLAALVGGIVAATGPEVTAEEAVQLGWGAAIGLIIAQLIAYLWGGYTAGRMARGVGWLNGLLVPITAIVLAFLIGLLIRAFGVDEGVAVTYGTAQVPVGLDFDQLRNIGMVAGIGSLIAMLLGGLFGGMLGVRWHDKLEARPDVRAP